MAVKTPKDLEKLYKQMSEQFGQYLQEKEAGERAAMAPGDPHALIEQARARLDAAVRDRDEGLRMANLRIERMKSELARLESSQKRAASPVEGVAEDKRKPKPKRG